MTALPAHEATGADTMGYKLRSLRALLVLGAGLWAPLPAVAHHSISGEFDTETVFQLRGVVTRFDWTNPHLWYYLDVAGADGEVSKWQCTTGSNPNRLIRAGWKQDDLTPGTVIRAAKAHPARDGSNTCYIRAITHDDGTPIFSGNKNN
jgi:hypothetical protein